MVTVSAPIYQSQPCLTFHHTNEKRLEGMRCCEMAESVCTRSILVWDMVSWYLTIHHPWLKSRGVVMVIHDEFKSQPCTSMHHTYDETLEGLRFCELPGSVQIHSICCGDYIRDHNPIPTMNQNFIVIGGLSRLDYSAWHPISLVKSTFSTRFVKNGDLPVKKILGLDD